jgi:uncharacterized membrane protein YdjX (TVP38/TMEM64 family)
MGIVMEKTTSSKLMPFLWLLAAGLIIVFAKAFNVQELLRRSLDWVRGLGPAGIAAFVAIYVLACVLFLPGSILTLGAGAIFGVLKGSVIVSFASVLGATLAFLIGRHLMRSWVESKIEGNIKFKAVDEAVAKEGWKIVGLTRLSPVFPFNLLNYAYGVTQVTLQDYVLASWIGMMPGTVMYVYIGSIAGDAAAIGGGACGPTGAAQWAVRIVGLAATVAVTVFVTRIAKKALERRVS